MSGHIVITKSIDGRGFDDHVEDAIAETPLKKIKLEDGSATAPTICYESAPTTGIYYDNGIGMTASGTKQLSVSSTGLSSENNITLESITATNTEIQALGPFLMYDFSSTITDTIPELIQSDNAVNDVGAEATWTDDLKKGVITLDGATTTTGTTQYNNTSLSAAAIAGFNQATLTICTWVAVSATFLANDFQGYTFHSGNGDERMRLYAGLNDNITIWFEDNNSNRMEWYRDITTAPQLNDGGWHHFIVEYNKQTVGSRKIYVDGVDDTAQWTKTTDIAQGADAFTEDIDNSCIFNYCIVNLNPPDDIHMGQLALFDRVLTAEERLTMYRGNVVSGFESNRISNDGNESIYFNDGEIYMEINDTEEAKVDASGLTLATGLILPNGVSTLNYYESGTHQSTYSGPWFIPTRFINYVRVGDTITLTCDDLILAATASGAITMTTVLPDHLIPLEYIHHVLSVEDNSTTQVGLMEISQLGAITIYADMAKTAFQNAGNAGFHGWTVSYTSL